MIDFYGKDVFDEEAPQGIRAELQKLYDNALYGRMPPKNALIELKASESKIGKIRRKIIDSIDDESAIQEFIDKEFEKRIKPFLDDDNGREFSHYLEQQLEEIEKTETFWAESEKSLERWLEVLDFLQTEILPQAEALAADIDSTDKNTIGEAPKYLKDLADNARIKSADNPIVQTSLNDVATYMHNNLKMDLKAEVLKVFKNKQGKQYSDVAIRQAITAAYDATLVS